MLSYNIPKLCSYLYIFQTWAGLQQILMILGILEANNWTSFPELDQMEFNNVGWRESHISTFYPL